MQTEGELSSGRAGNSLPGQSARAAADRRTAGRHRTPPGTTPCCQKREAASPLLNALGSRLRGNDDDEQPYGLAACPDSSSGAFVCLMKICAAQMPTSYSRHIGTARASCDTTSGGVITAAMMKASTTK